METDILSQVTNIIASNAFPIVMCLMLLRQNNDIRKEMSQLTETHKQETDRLAEVIQGNTIALTELKERLGA